MRHQTALGAAAISAGLAMAMSAPATGASARALPSPPTPSPKAAAAADQFVSSGRAPVHASPKDRIVRRGVAAGAGGLQFVSYERTHAGLPVQGGDFVVTTDAAGTVLSTSSAQNAELTVPTTPTVSAAQATAASRKQLRTVTRTSAPTLSVLAEGSGRLVYETVVTGTRRPPGSYGHGPGGSYGHAKPPGSYGHAKPPGSYGVAGPGGSYGYASPPGSYGYAGPPGSYGFAGPPGSYGFAGPPGSYGFAGPPGSYGFAGPPGSYGAVAAKQNAGPPGSYGFAGPPGSYGFAGPPGSYGFAGPTGSYGHAKPPGSYGHAKPPGSYGFAGPGGSYGFSGPRGSYGLAGPPGSYGLAAQTARPSVLHVFVDARTGKVVRTWDEVTDLDDDQSFYHGGRTKPTSITTSGSPGSYTMRDPSRPGISCSGQSGAPYTGTDDAWGNADGVDLETACVDSLKAAQAEFDMAKTWLGRNGLDGHGGGWPIRVGLNDANAYWSGSYANFGHNRSNTKQATATDVVAHELGHAIMQTTPGGILGDNEKGALNESTGDIFGALTEWYLHEPRVAERFSGTVALLNYDPPDYTLGEEVDLVGSGPIRYMYKPSLIGGHRDCFDAKNPPQEPHEGAGVQNHWFYLLAEGSNANDPDHGRPNSPTCNDSKVTGIGIQKAGLIFMSALNTKTSNWTHTSVRRTSIQAALNLVRAKKATCTDFTRTRDAWNAVSVPASSGEPTTCTG
ncbi:M4 family metallopeptidase [Actinomadura roseirufa]|uniref:M4 family metallopeptidase n=1 Tax=Actinomadura roseirufa TaxID=2094049 RepID=UPI0010413903|nr:M4 family metallopeptidase [Actinomadura roseirufa]